MIESLHILYGDNLVGHLSYDRRKDVMSHTYEEEWRFDEDSFPISATMPLARKVHADATIRPFLEGLLPDNPAVLDAWGRRFHVSPRNAFDMIKHVGEDCAGGFLFVRPDRWDRIVSGEFDSLTPLDDAGLEKRMEMLRSPSRVLPADWEGRFSLAGEQSKDALHRQDGCWFVSGGRIPSTHILKPEGDGLDHHALNEHFCLRLAEAVGLPSAASEIISIGGAEVLCVKRYDRFREKDGMIRRIHQEDSCQATGHPPGRKYQADGGPCAAEVVRLLDRYSMDRADDVLRFVMALAFNWIIVGTDAHSKNYSLLHARGSALRLAPLYDLASWIPYERDPHSRKIKLAMKIGGTYRLHEIDGAHWRAWAEEAGLDKEGVMEIVCMTVDRIGTALEPLRESMIGMDADGFLVKLCEGITNRARICERILA